MVGGGDRRGGDMSREKWWDIVRGGVARVVGKLITCMELVLNGGLID